MLNEAIDFQFAQEAEESIRFYKNIRKTDEHQLETLKKELDRVKNAATDDDLEANQMRPLQWADFKTKHARTALSFGLFFAVLHEFSGGRLMTSPAVFVWYRSPAWMPMPIPWEVLIVSGVALLGSYLAMHLVDRIGRKALLTWSAVGSLISLTIYGLYQMIFHAHDETSVNSFTLISSISTVFFGFLGFQSLQFTLFTEYMPERIKDVGLTFCIVCSWILKLAFTAFVFVIGEGIGDYVVALILAVICLASVFTIHLKIPETKGKSHQEIMKSF